MDPHEGPGQPSDVATRASLPFWKAVADCCWRKAFPAYVTVQVYQLV